MTLVWIIKMLQYKKIDVLERIDTDKASAPKKCILCHYLDFKDVWFKFEQHVCNKYHDVLMTAYELKSIEMFNVKGVDFRCILWVISRDEAINRLDNSVLDDKDALSMECDANKTPVEVIKEGSFGGTYFRDIYSGVNEKRHRNSWCALFFEKSLKCPFWKK